MSYSLGVSLTFLTVLFSSWRVSNLNIVRAIRDLPEPDKKPRRRSLFLGIGLALFGALLMLTGVSSKQMAPWAMGISLVLIGFAIGARYLRAPERPLFTAVGLVILAYWSIAAGERIPGPEMTGGIELFFLSGIMMVAAATFVVMYNAHLLLNLLAFGGRRMGRIFPSIKTAIAYPLASKFRTGMTMAMIALVIFALTMMSVDERQLRPRVPHAGIPRRLGHPPAREPFEPHRRPASITRRLGRRHVEIPGCG